MNSKRTEKIKLWGIVQGVGFRPFVAKMAKEMSMVGEVLNIGGLVEITLTDTKSRIDDFIDAIIANKPGPSEIVHIKRLILDTRDFDSFEIIRSGYGDDEASMIPADLAICPNCQRELYDKNNPRFAHPFISCMICGPRYTIIDKIPYDRENTTMIDYPMCKPCTSEYTNISDRRFHAQTISCHDCGPELIWKSHTEEYTGDTRILDTAADILRNGGVIAFKSVGGYNLVANPFNEFAVNKLREIKHRPSKPFAIMFRSIEEVSKYCHVSETEKSLLTSSARPIILLEHKLDDIRKNVASNINDLCPEDIEFNEKKYIDDLNQSRFIGSFLPSFAAQYLLLDRISPLIFTSANTSDLPMIKDDDEMLHTFENNMDFSSQIDGIIYNKRRILTRVDDSVVRVIDNQPQMIRRSKGYAPVPLFVEINEKSSDSRLPQILATGSQLKNSFALSKDNFVYISQYFGDMDTLENQQIYAKSLERMKSLFRIKPEYVVCDMHPLYFTSDFANNLATKGIPLLKVQHHHAHIASVIAENNIKGPVIGISFDGTGYGTDGNIWGGEFMICENHKMKRISHLKYVKMIGGDSSMKDAVRSALSYISEYDSYDASGYLNEAADSRETTNSHESTDSYDAIEYSNDGSMEITLDISDIIKFGKERILSKPESKLTMAALSANINTIRSSSMGRLFDAVSALLGICEYNSHEGKCAIMLEDAAAFAKSHPGCASDRLGNAETCRLALDFHNRVIDMIVSQCISIRNKFRSINCELSQVALTGGTFQNKIIMEGVLESLRKEGFLPYYNVSVSPNDGGIALGQIYIAMHTITEEDNVEGQKNNERTGV